MSPDPQILELLPHRPPMTMLAQVVSVDTPGVAVAVADTSAESVFYDADLDGVPACVALEYMAQTMALAMGSARRRKGEAPQIGFVLGTRRLNVKVAAFARGARYVVTARCTYVDDGAGAFDCSIAGPDGATVAEATLSAFLPPAATVGDFRELGNGKEG